MEFKGKTVEEAVEKALKELSLTKDEVNVTIVEEKKGLFGTKVTVEVEPKIATAEIEETETPVCNAEITSANGAKSDGERTVDFLDGLFKLLNMKACSEVVEEGEKITINVTATNSTSVIGKHGGMLDAIQTLAGAVANTGRDDYKRVVVDCENYRENRESTLQRLAERLAEKAIRMGRKVKLEPMNPYERRIIHSFLSENPEIKTESEGKEPNRYIVIVPANLEDPDAPAIPARSERRNDRGGKGGYNRGGKGGYNRGGKGGRSGGFNKRSGGGKPVESKGGTSLKNTDFFGIFLGNSGNNGDE